MRRGRQTPRPILEEGGQQASGVRRRGLYEDVEIERRAGHTMQDGRDPTDDDVTDVMGA